MKIYFGSALKEDVENFGDDGVFTLERQGETHYFYQGVEHGTNAGGINEVAIFDGCGRMVPIAIDQIPELIEALSYCFNKYQDIQLAKKQEELVESNAATFVVSNPDEDYCCFVEDISTN